MLLLADIRKRYADTVAVDGLSLRVERGEIFGLLGPNGAGKSTTIAIGVGLLNADSGEATLEGLGRPTDPRVRAQIGLAPQSLAIYEDLSAEENLAFFGRLYSLSGARLRERVGAMLEFAGLTDRRRHRVKTYSGGMKRRLNMACALVHEPSLVMFDEPTVGVDPQSRNAIFESILALKAAGLTVLYTTHYMEEAERLCDRVGVMDRGRLLALGSVRDLLAAHGGASVITVEREGTAGEERHESADPARDVVPILGRGGVRAVRIDRPSLESVFLSLTGRSLRD